MEASDGIIGEVADFLIDGRTWVLREIVIGRSLVFWKGDSHTYEKITRISYAESTVYVDSTSSDCGNGLWS